MRVAIAAVLAVIGVILLVMGFQASDSIASDFSRFFTGSPTDKAVWLLVGGAASLVAGVVLGIMSSRRLPS